MVDCIEIGIKPILERLPKTTSVEAGKPACQPGSQDPAETYTLWAKKDLHSSSEESQIKAAPAYFFTL